MSTGAPTEAIRIKQRVAKHIKIHVTPANGLEDWEVAIYDLIKENDKLRKQAFR